MSNSIGRGFHDIREDGSEILVEVWIYLNDVGETVMFMSIAERANSRDIWSAPRTSEITALDLPAESLTKSYQTLRRKK